MPIDAWYREPGPGQTTGAWPSPMFQLIEDTLAVVVTATAPAVAVAVAGPYVAAPGFTHFHIGMPIT